MKSKWGEYLGREKCPYARRWYIESKYLGSIRIHHFMGPDDTRYLHDHPWWYFTIILKGKYEDRSETPVILGGWKRFAFRKAEHAHAVIPLTSNGVWTLVLTGRKTRTWGFWINGKWKKSLRFFFDIGHPPCE
jgi:hypothetical protein